jgi:hypothetical protein
MSLHLYKNLRFQNKSLHFFEREFKKPQNLSKIPTLCINLHLSGNNLKKPTSLSLKMPLLKSLGFFESLTSL